jgi:hypothetical protein
LIRIDSDPELTLPQFEKSPGSPHVSRKNCESSACHTCGGRESNKAKNKIRIRSVRCIRSAKFLEVALRNELKKRIPLPCKGRRPVTPSGGAGCGARGLWLVTSAPGRLGHHPAGTMTGVRGASLDWDRQGRVTPAQRIGPAGSQEAWPDAEPWGRKSFWPEPQWNAGRRTRRVDFVCADACRACKRGGWK